ncbi:MAG: PKD domain-containing protein, partial [Bacteroidota bacterium]
MKLIRLVIFLFSILVFSNLLAQNEANIWYFGGYAGLDFSSGSPVALTNSAMDQIEGCASISDNNGNLLFYTEGTTVWNKNHVIMDNGTGLLGNFSSTQSSIIIQKPGSDTLYYIFTVPQRSNNLGDMHYSIVDISLNGGLGKIITKNTYLHTPVTEKVTAVAHANGQDIWVITHERETNAFCSFLISSSGVSNTPVVSNVGSVHDLPDMNFIGYLKASTNANYIACTLYGPMSLIEIFDFDNSTGLVSNPISITGYIEPYGVEFSPDDSRLYIGAGDEIVQFDLMAGSPTDIINSATIISGSYVEPAGALQLGPDQKIYRTTYLGDYLDVINSPNELGDACNYVSNAIYLDGMVGKMGLPTFFQSYFSASINYQNVCFGDTTYFDISISDPISSVTWDFGDPASGSNNTSTALQPYHIFTSTGTYNVTATIILTDGSTQLSSVDVTIFDIPQINIGNDTTICGAANLLLDAGSGFSSYVWQDNSINQTYTVTQPGTYWVAVTNSNGCSSTDSIVVNETPPFDIFLGNDSIYCFQSSVTLNAGNIYANYLWQDGSTNSTLTVYDNGTYWVNVTDANGCIGGDTILVSFFRNNVILGNDTTICSGSSVNLDAGIGFIYYLWNTGETTQSIIANTSGTYNVEASYAHCVSYDTIELAFFPSATSFAGSNESICQYEQFDFSTCAVLPLATNNDSILWFGGNGTFSNSTQLYPIYTLGIGELGNITLSLIAYSSGDCPNDTSSMILSVGEKPVSQINVLPSSVGCVGSPLLFEGSSTTNITNWIWDFNDGSGLINGQNVSHTYSSSGNFTVSLTVISSDGCSDTSSNSILINSLPFADYSYLPSDSLCVNELISFTDNSTSNIQSWGWDFDDGNISTQQNPQYSFSTSGNYNVQLLVTDNNTCADSVSLPVQVNPLPEPDFNILPNDTICAELPLALVGFDIAGTSITEWNWDFGDGNVSTLQNPTHTYVTPGDYVISLNLLNDNSCTETQFKQVHIQSLPESSFTIAPNDTSCMGELINFDATNITGDISLWSWKFGDGNTGIGQNVNHIFSDPNSQTYNILSIFQNSNGCVDTTILQRVVQYVTIDFDVVQSPSCQNNPVVFTGTDGLVTFTDWNWDFGDGSASGFGHNESHVYTQPDTVDVQLNVCSEQLIKQLVIVGTCDVDAGSNEATCQDVYFNLNHSTILPTADAFDSIAWSTNGFGYFDDYTLMRPTYFPHPSEGAIQNDTLIMTMVGYGIAPCENDTSTMELIVIPGAYAQAGSDENSCFGVPYDFANSTDSSFATNYATIYWVTSGTGSFVNPNVEHPIYIPGSNEIGPVTLTMVAANIINCDSIDDMVLTIRPAYEMPVDITVCYYDSVFVQGTWQYTSGTYYDTLLTVNYGCDSVIVTNLTVRPKIDKDFTINTSDSICFGEIVAFTSIGTANLSDWMWDFGDGVTTNLPDPTHQYNAFGDFTIIYHYTDINGCSDSSTHDITVFDLPYVDFTINMTNACVNTQVNFLGTGTSNIDTWNWDFGDGQSGVGQTTSHVYNTWGYIQVLLTVTDVNGCSETTIQTLTIAQPPIADFSYESVICDSILFTNLSTSAPGYNIVQGIWNYGDGSPLDTTDYLEPTYHQYPSSTTPGGATYNVTLLVVADSSGFICTDSIVLPVIVPPLPDIFYTVSPDPTCLGDTTHFYGESGYFIDTWHWNFGDGNTALTQYADNLYTVAGDYTVTLDIIDTLGCANTLTKILTVNPVPDVSFTMSDSVTCHGNAITFIGTGSPNIEEWYWEFGDG